MVELVYDVLVSSAMDRSERSPRRKRLRIGHISERGGVNAVRTLLENGGLVVSEVEGRSDYGRDLIVDITEGNEITGAVIAVQVKGDRRSSERILGNSQHTPLICATGLNQVCQLSGSFGIPAAANCGGRT
jgi:hypothetical protein